MLPESEGTVQVLNCPRCSRAFGVPDNALGLRVVCPHCRAQLSVGGSIPNLKLTPTDASAGGADSDSLDFLGLGAIGVSPAAFQAPAPPAVTPSAGVRARGGGSRYRGEEGEATTAADVVIAETQSPIPVFKNDPVLVLLLGLVTCGLYLIYWNWKMAQVINAVSGKQLVSPLVAVFSGWCFPVNLYFYYLCGESLRDIGKLIGEPNLKDKSLILLILGVFVPMVAAMIMQGYVNRIYGQK